MKIAIIGAGPRGLALTSQLFNLYKTNLNNPDPLLITIFDPIGIGGRVWRKDQWNGFLMNTPADQITMFTDNTVTLKGRVTDGPSLFEWAISSAARDYLTNHHYAATTVAQAASLTSKDYAPRVLFGAYLNWFFEDIMNVKPHQIKVEVIEKEVVDLQINEDQTLEIITDDGAYTVNKVVMNLGQQSNYLNEKQQQLANYALDHDLTYIQPGHPGDVNLDQITPGNPVIMRGLGLNFYDFIGELTVGRGGKFTQDNQGTWYYQPSGSEPIILAGSRHGIPYMPKPISQKEYGQMAQPVFLSAANIQSQLEDGHLPYEKFINLLTLDLELVYYSLLISQQFPRQNVEEFQQIFITAPDKQAVIDQYGFNPEEIFDLKYLMDPFQDIQVISTIDYQTVVSNWLDNLNQEALLGSKTSPLLSALELLRDFRPTFRSIIDQQLFTKEDYYNGFIKRFKPIFKFLAEGPTVIRTEQLSALIRAGIVVIIPKQMEIQTSNNLFRVSSPKANNDVFEANALIEAYLDPIDATVTANPLLENLLNSGLAAVDKIEVNGYQESLGSINVDPQSYQLVNKDYLLVDNIYLWGVSLEGTKFSTTVSPRPGVNDNNLQSANRLAQELLDI